MKRRPLLVVLGLLGLALVLPMSGGRLGFGDGNAVPSGSPPRPTAEAVATVVPEPTPTDVAASVAPSATPEPTPAPTPGALADVAIAPVTHFRAAAVSTNRDEVAAVLTGTSKRYEALELVESQADAILAAIGAERPTDAARLVLVSDAGRLTRDLAKHRKRLAFLGADAVTPAVRALAWGGRTLFGVGRITKASDWRLRAQLQAPAADAAFDPGATWTMFAGGDILLDRGVYQTVKVNGRGVDFPFNGGTAEITGHTC